MPCICGEISCICCFLCSCQSPNCICQSCIFIRENPRQQVLTESPIKQNDSPKKSRSVKKSTRWDPLNKQSFSSTNDSPSGQNQMNTSASATNQRKETLGSSSTIEASKPPLNDPHATIKKHLSHPPQQLLNLDHPLLRKQLSDPIPPQTNYPHPKIRRQFSQPPPPSNNHCPTLIRQLSEPCKILNRGNLFSELPSSISHTNPFSTGGSSSSFSNNNQSNSGGSSSSSLSNNKPSNTGGSSSSFSNNNLSLPSTSKAGNFKEYRCKKKSSNSTKSRSKKIPASPTDSNKLCPSMEYIKQASDKALPSYESFSSRFTALSNDENDNRNLELNTSQNRDTGEIITDPSSHSAEVHAPLYLDTSDAISASSNNPQSHNSLNLIPMLLSPQMHPLNLSLSVEDKLKISPSKSAELSSRSPSPIPSKQQKTDTDEFSSIPTSEWDDQRRASFSQESSDVFCTRHEPLSSGSVAQRSEPKTSSASTSGSLYTSCIVRNPSLCTVITEHKESPMQTEASSRNFDQNITSYPLPVPSTSNYFPTHFSRASAPDTITYCNDLNDGRNFTLRMTSSNLHNIQEIQNFQSPSADFNRFSEISYNPNLEREMLSPIYVEISSTDRQSVIRYSSSQPSSEPTSELESTSANQATNPVNISYYQGQRYHASSSTFESFMDLSDARLLASQTCDEPQITPQASAFFHPTVPDVNMVPVFSITAPTGSEGTDPIDQSFLNYQQSSTLQSASGIINSERTANYENEDETGENNYFSRIERKLN